MFQNMNHYDKKYISEKDLCEWIAQVFFLGISDRSYMRYTLTSKFSEFDRPIYLLTYLSEVKLIRPIVDGHRLDDNSLFDNWMTNVPWTAQTTDIIAMRWIIFHFTSTNLSCKCDYALRFSSVDILTSNAYVLCIVSITIAVGVDLSVVWRNNRAECKPIPSTCVLGISCSLHSCWHSYRWRFSKIQSFTYQWLENVERQQTIQLFSSVSSILFRDVWSFTEFRKFQMWINLRNALLLFYNM